MSLRPVALSTLAFLGCAAQPVPAASQARSTELANDATGVGGASSEQDVPPLEPGQVLLEVVEVTPIPGEEYRLRLRLTAPRDLLVRGGLQADGLWALSPHRIEWLKDGAWVHNRTPGHAAGERQVRAGEVVELVDVIRAPEARRPYRVRQGVLVTPPLPVDGVGDRKSGVFERAAREAEAELASSLLARGWSSAGDAPIQAMVAAMEARVRGLPIGPGCEVDGEETTFRRETALGGFILDGSVHVQLELACGSGSATLVLDLRSGPFHADGVRLDDGPRLQLTVAGNPSVWLSVWEPPLDQAATDTVVSEMRQLARELGRPAG